MKDLKKLSLNKEVKKEAEEIEKEVESRSDLDDIKVSDDMETSLFNKIQEYEYDKRLKKVHYRRKRRYLIVALAAVIVLVCGSVMTGVGSKSYWKVIWERITGDGPTEITNVEDMDSHETEDIDEVGVYRKINETFGISIVRLKYKPENTLLKRYTFFCSISRVYRFNFIPFGLYLNLTIEIPIFSLISLYTPISSISSVFCESIFSTLVISVGPSPVILSHITFQ